MRCVMYVRMYVRIYHVCTYWAMVSSVLIVYSFGCSSTYIGTIGLACDDELSVR